MEATEYSRKLDSYGRLSIPIKLREKLGMQQDDEFDFFIHKENGKTYLCVECTGAEAMELSMEAVKAYLASRGYDITPKV